MKQIRRIMAALLALGFQLLATANAQVTSYAIPLSGIMVQCQTSTGYQVPITLSDEVYQSIGQAGYDAQGRPYLVISPSWLNQVPYQSAMFWFYHECAHVNLPFGIGVGSPYQETNADCWAINQMARHGLIRNYADMQAIAAGVANLPGSNLHLPGPQRVQRMMQCAY